MRTVCPALTATTRSFRILSFGNGSVGFYINDDRCGKFDMLGEYTAIGD